MLQLSRLVDICSTFFFNFFICFLLFAHSIFFCGDLLSHYNFFMFFNCFFWGCKWCAICLSCMLSHVFSWEFHRLLRFFIAIMCIASIICVSLCLISASATAFADDFCFQYVAAYYTMGALACMGACCSRAAPHIAHLTVCRLILMKSLWPKLICLGGVT